MWGRAGIHEDSTAVFDTHTRALVETDRQRAFGTNAARLDVGGDANAHQLALGTLLSLLSAQVLVVDEAQCFIQGSLVVTAVIYSAGGRLVRELIRLKEIEPAYFSR